MLDGYLVRYFLGVVETGSFTGAAARANVTQPTLSAGIAKIERELGTTLFLRSARRIELTPDGTRFLVRARNMLQEYNLALGELGEGAKARALRLGVLHTVAGASVAAIARAYLSIDSANAIEIVEGSDHELIARLDGGRIDMALTLHRDAAQFAPHIVADEDYVLALSPAHALAGADVIEPEALRADAMIVRRRCEVLAAVSRHFTSRGVRPPLAYRTVQEERALAMVAAGIGVTVLPRSSVNSEVVAARLGGFDLQRSLSVLTSPIALARTRDAEAMRCIIGEVYARTQ